MGNWAVNIYNSLEEAATAIEGIDSGVTIHILGFKEGALQKIMVVNATT